MFSPAPTKLTAARTRESPPNHGGPSSPATPIYISRHSATPMPHRPATGTPAPWSSHLSTASRTPALKETEKTSGAAHTRPVFVCEFPQQVRNAEVEWLRTHGAGTTGISGGMDRATGLCWKLCGRQVFIWSYLSGNAPQRCIVLEIPKRLCLPENDAINAKHGYKWTVAVIPWEKEMCRTDRTVKECSSAGILMCSQKSLAVIYWPDIFSEHNYSPIVSLPTDDHHQPDGIDVLVDDRIASSRKSGTPWVGSSSSSEFNVVNSMIASPISGSALYECIAIACRSNAELWHFECSVNGIKYHRVAQDFELKKTYIRSIIWRCPYVSLKEGERDFFLLTDHEIQCWNVELRRGGAVSKTWTYHVLGTGDTEIKKDLAGEKHVLLLDMQVEDSQKEIIVLVASFCKDRLSSSSYTEYSLLKLCYKSSGQKMRGDELASGIFLERKAPVRVIFPKSQVEEDFLFSMHLRVGGKPAGSTMILSGDGTATVTYYWNEATSLYQFELPWDAGKVLDASIIPSVDGGEEGAWIVLTEKAGLWAIPEKAILLGGAEPPERSLSRKGTSNEGVAEEERQNLVVGGNFSLRRASTEAWIARDNGERAVLKGVGQRTAQDEEAETLIGHLFQNFLNSGQIERAFEKLHQAGAFERDGEMNVFTRASRAIVDTLAKHWTASRGANIAVMAAVSSQLLEKQHRHQQFLQFLAASKCHEELQMRQREALQSIMGHGEKLSAMIRLRELHNASAQARPQSRLESLNTDLQHSEMSGSLWDLVQIVGEKARRNNVMLMDREKAEVFYSRVSELEELFSCVNQHLTYVVGRELPLRLQIERLREISIACTSVVRTAIHYRDIQYSWYPSPEGLTPWYCQLTVRSGIWKLGSLILELKMEADVSEPSMKSVLASQLEEVTDILLEAYAGAITAKVEREEEYRGLQAEYWSRRDNLLNALYLHLKDVAEAAAQDVGVGVQGEEQRKKVLRSLSPSLIALARRHAGYQTLWDICSDLNDMGCLRSLMHESMGLKEGRFSNFVFEQCYKKRQYAKLLRLGEEFQEELASFLQKHKDILWLHEIYLNQFTSASNTLHRLAFSQKDGLTSSDEDQAEIGGCQVNLLLDERRRLLNLGRPIAVDAGAQLYTILELCRAFDRIFKEHLDGGRPGGERVYGVFDNQLPAALKKLPFDRHLSLQNVRKVVSEADGYQPHLIAPEQGYRRLIDGALGYFKGPAEASVDAVHFILKELVRKSLNETQELKRFPTLQSEVAAAANEALERFREDGRKTATRLVEMESSYLTVEFFRKLPQEVEKGGNPQASAIDRYTEAHLRRIGSNVSAYVGMVCETLKNSIPKAVVYCQVREAKNSLLNHFYTQVGRKEGKQLAALLDEDPALMERREGCAKRLELYKAARDEIDAVSWARS